MDRRPISEDQGRVKRRKTDDMDSRYDGESDDDGGVKLGNYGHPTAVKPKREDLDTKSSNYTNGKDTSIEKSTSKKRKKEEGWDEASNPYLAEQYEGSAKKTKLDPRENPYLAHRYEEPAEDESNYNGYNHGYTRPAKRMDGALKASSLTGLARHKTTAAMAKKAEYGPNNPFNGQPLSSQYFSILKTRQNLPVHQQRYAQRDLGLERYILTPCTGMNSYRCIRSRNFSCLLERLVPGRLPRYLSSYCLMINHTFSASWWLARSLAEWQLCPLLNA